MKLDIQANADEIPNHATGGGGKKQDFTNVIGCLIDMVKSLTDQVSQLKETAERYEKEMDSVQKKNRVLEDELDNCRMRNMKGNFILTSNQGNSRQKIIKSEDELKAMHRNLTDHTIELIKEKYDIDIGQNEIYACHRLGKKGDIIFRLVDRKDNSALHKLHSAMKTGRNASVNVFANIQMTPKRNELLFNIRQLKGENKISGFSSDQNGNISFFLQGMTTRFVATYFRSQNSAPVTMTPDELHNFVDSRLENA